MQKKLLCEKRGYVSADGKPGFDWEDHEVFWSNIYVRRRSARREVTANVEKAVFAVVLCAQV